MPETWLWRCYMATVLAGTHYVGVYEAVAQESAGHTQRHLLGVSRVWSTFYEQFGVLLSHLWDWVSESTKSSLVLRNQGLDFWPQSSCPWPCKAICTSHGPADGCICSFPSERLISVTGQLPFPAFLTEAWWKQMCQRSPFCLPSKWIYSQEKRVLCG